VKKSPQGIERRTRGRGTSYALSDHIETLHLGAGKAIDGTGNAQDNTLYGNSSDNVLSGAAGNDTLIGQEGNDRLDGGTGADALDGNNTLWGAREAANDAHHAAQPEWRIAA
jgi:Ca2+-binding RTX toxin-like protein